MNLFGDDYDLNVVFPEALKLDVRLLNLLGRFQRHPGRSWAAWVDPCRWIAGVIANAAEGVSGCRSFQGTSITAFDKKREGWGTGVGCSIRFRCGNERWKLKMQRFKPGRRKMIIGSFLSFLCSQTSSPSCFQTFLVPACDLFPRRGSQGADEEWEDIPSVQFWDQWSVDGRWPSACLGLRCF